MGTEKGIQNIIGNPKGKKPLGRIGIDVRTLLKWIPDKRGGDGKVIIKLLLCLIKHHAMKTCGGVEV
jgi:hypothetical protein